MEIENRVHFKVYRNEQEMITSIGMFVLTAGYPDARLANKRDIEKLDLEIRDEIKAQARLYGEKEKTSLTEMLETLKKLFC